MARSYSLSSRRMGVAGNYTGVTLLALVILAGEYGTWNPLLITLFFLFLTFSLATYLITYIRTGIFRLVRSKSEELDEREILLTHKAYRQAYIFISAACMVLLFIMFLGVRYSWITLTHRGHYSFGMVLLLYIDFLFLSVPASIIAWKERVVENQ